VRRLTRPLPTAVVVAGLALAGACGDDDGPDQGARTTTTAAPGPTGPDGGPADEPETFGPIGDLEPDEVFAEDVPGYDFEDVSPELGLQILRTLRSTPAVDEAVTGYAGRLARDDDGEGEVVAVVIALAYEPGAAPEALRAQLLEGNTAEVTLSGQDVISALDPIGQPSIAYVDDRLTIWTGGDDQERLRAFTEALLLALGRR
jgi:hypothetical protein